MANENLPADKVVAELERIDRRGGLGYDSHDAIRAAIDHIDALERGIDRAIELIQPDNCRQVLDLLVAVRGGRVSHEPKEHPPALMAVVDKWQDAANAWRSGSLPSYSRHCDAVDALLKDIRGASLETSGRRKARSEEERTAEPGGDAHVRCASCDQGLIGGEAFDYARECCEKGKQFDIEHGVAPRSTLNTEAQRSTILPCGCDTERSPRWMRIGCGCLPKNTGGAP